MVFGVFYATASAAGIGDDGPDADALRGDLIFDTLDRRIQKTVESNTRAHIMTGLM